MISHGKTVYFIGIGGAGMNGLAHILLEQGLKVRGSDIQSTNITRRLKAQGAQIFIGHEASHIEGADVVVYSSAIKKDNPELARARFEKKYVLSRAELLAQLTNQKKSILISGTHGKTTTTS